MASLSAPALHVVLLGVSLPAVLPASPASQAADLRQLAIENWSPDSGLAGRWVRGVVEDRLGFLWVATSGGLSRFDGHEFRNFTAANTAELPVNSVTALARGRDGGIWIGLEDNGVRVLRDGRIEKDPRLEPLGSATVNVLLEDEAGDLWIATDSGLWWASDDEVHVVAPSESTRSARLRSLALGPDGDVWARSEVDGLWRARSGSIERVYELGDCFGIGLAVRESTRIVLPCEEGLFELDPAGEALVAVAATQNPRVAYLDRSGNVWFGHRGGLSRLTLADLQTIEPERGIGDWRLRAFYEDERGDLWIGTYSGGLARLRLGPVWAVGADDGLMAEATTGVLGLADGSVLVGTYRQGAFLWHPRQGEVRRWTTRDGLPSDRVWSFALDAQRPEKVWVGTSRGLVSIEGGSVRRHEPLGLPFDDAVYVLYSDPLAEETLWVSGWSGGAVEIQGSRRVVHDHRNGLALDRVRFFHRARSGHLLAGGLEGLFEWDGSRWSRRLLDGERVGSLRAILELGETLWLSSKAEGLVRWSAADGLTRYGPGDGLPLREIFSIAGDHSGIWLSGDEGLFRFRPDDFEAWVRAEMESVPLVHLTARDGLSDLECNGWGSPTVGTFADGTLAYPTMTGVARVDRARLRTAALEPEEVLVDTLWVGARALDSQPLVQLGETERSLRARFAAVELLQPEAVVFRYRLEGWDDSWVAAGQDREAVYSHLPPGRFHLRVQARLPGQPWVEAARGVEVVVAPTPFEAPWFRFVATGLVLSLVLGLLLWRGRVHRRHAEALREERSFLRQVIDTSPDPIFAKSSDQTYLLANQAAAGIYGLSPGELEGRRVPSESSRLQGMDRIEAIDSTVLESGEERVTSAEEVVDSRGARHWYRVIKRPLFGATGEVERVVGTAVDVTEYKETEASLRRSREELHHSREEARRLSLQILRAQEEERRRLGREIHDDVTQRLAGLAMLAGGAAGAASGESSENVRKARDTLQELRADLEVLARDTQRLSRDLHPSLFDNAGLEEALRSECATLTQRTGLSVGYTCDRIPTTLTAEASLVLFRIAQEALRNALTHSRATAVSVSLEARNGDVILAVEDHGIGFEPTAARVSRGLGLASMEERARLVGGDLEIDSAPGLGTRVRVTVPVDPVG